jgi:hypothetical protein
VYLVTIPDDLFGTKDFHCKHEELFSRHLQGLPDDSTVVLKAHLLIEELCRDFCSAAVANPEHLRNARFTFSHVSKLARALSPFDSPSFDYLWAVVKRLTSMRNMLSHELEPNVDDFAKNRRVILDLVNNNRGDIDTTEEIDILSGALSFVIGAMATLLEANLMLINSRNTHVDAHGEGEPEPPSA